MSMRPRFAGDGRLRLPMTIGVVTETSAFKGFWTEGAIAGELGGPEYDPFERVASGLLLAEEFARVDLSDRQVAVSWHARHGAVDIAQLAGARASWAMPAADERHFRDAARDVAFEQANVAWHLRCLARLSDHLPGDGQTPPDWPAGWQASWAQPVLRMVLQLIWLGGGNEFERHISTDMAHAPEPSGLIPTGMDLTEYAAWWRQAHAAYQTIVRERVPFVTVHEASNFQPWDRDAIFGGASRALMDGLTTGWWGLAELQRRLIEPYVRSAGKLEVAVSWRAGDSNPDAGRGSVDGGRLGPLAVDERRRWDSLLGPVYLQLLEGLRRVTEGDRGAAFCKECGQPFLTLDARRSSFCNDRERFRFTQRERRRRLAVPPPSVPRGMPR